METKILGKDFKVSAIGLGCMGMTHGFGDASNQKEMIEVIRKAYQEGITMFDTAECYQGIDSQGNKLYNEDLLGEALSIYPRDSYQIATKCGIKVVNGQQVLDARPEVIRDSLANSLKRLKTDYVDLYYLHRIDPNTPIEVVANTMKKLIEEGKIRHWGISEADEDTIRRAHAICPLTAIQNRYSMMYRDYESLFNTLEELEISFVAFSPLANGLLSDAYNQNSTFSDEKDYRGTMPQFQKEAYQTNQQLFEMIRTISKEKNCTPAQLSLAWMINKKPYIIPIPGTRKSTRLKENLDAANILLTKEEIAKIDAILDKIPMSSLYGRK